MTRATASAEKGGSLHIDVLIKKIKEIEVTDNDNIAAIGYCFGGFVVLNAAKTGSNLKGVVSFHGNLTGAPPDKLFMKTQDFLICQGLEDKFVSPKEVSYFNFQMDSAKVHYTFKTYVDATHAFTNPDATKLGKQFNMPIEYNEQADKDSWSDMKNFLDNLFKNNKK
jgi:dienelactone hydrolase